MQSVWVVFGSNALYKFFASRLHLWLVDRQPPTLEHQGLDADSTPGVWCSSGVTTLIARIASIVLPAVPVYAIARARRSLSSPAPLARRYWGESP